MCSGDQYVQPAGGPEGGRVSTEGEHAGKVHGIILERGKAAVKSGICFHLTPLLATGLFKGT